MPEGQRRYVESLSSFARQFLGQMPKPDVDRIVRPEPVDFDRPEIRRPEPPLDRRHRSPRSTITSGCSMPGWARAIAPNAGGPSPPKPGEQIIARIAALPAGKRLLVLAPLVRGQKGEYRDLFEDLLKQGFVRARVDGQVVHFSDDLRLDRQMRHDIDVVVDRLAAGPKSRARLAEAVELALRLGNGNLLVAAESEAEGGEKRRRAEGGRRKGGHAAPLSLRGRTASGTRGEGERLGPSPSRLSLSAHYACTHCQLSFEPPSPQLFSFNSPQGMCPECSGLGQIYTFDPERLVSDPCRSFQQGCIELLGSWREMGRWRRHIFRGVAEMLERKHGLSRARVLETAWEELDQRVRQALLWGTGEEHIAFTWRSGPSGYKWGGKFEGIIPKLLAQYRTTRSRLQRRQLEKYMRILGCERCHGQRLNAQAAAVTLTTAPPSSPPARSARCRELCALPICDAEEFFAALELDATGQAIAVEALKEIRSRLQFLKNVGLEYLTLDRTAPTLSGGEMQRIRLAGQIGCGLVGVLYILDEPSIGLHPRDNDKLLETLAQLRDQGNTVIVVEHDEDTMRAADHIVDFGPGPGVRGGPHRGQPARSAASSPQPGKRHRRSICRASGGSRFPPAAARPAADAWSSAAPGTTTSRASTWKFRWACSCA